MSVCVSCLEVPFPDFKTRAELFGLGWTDVLGKGLWECPNCAEKQLKKLGDSTMSVPITQHEGKKYLRTIRAAYAVDAKFEIEVDVYCVIEAYKITCPAQAQALKKVLCAGQRGKGSKVEDFKGAIAALNRAIELEEDREEQNPQGS